MKPKEVRGFALNNLMYIIAGGIMLIYIATALIGIRTTGRTLMQIFQDGSLFFLLSVVVGNLFNLQGIFKGNQSEEVKEAEKRKNDMRDKVEPVMQHLGSFCEDKNAFRLKSKRTKILSSEGLAYNDCFDDKGKSIDKKFDYEPSRWKRFCGKQTLDQEKEWHKYCAFRKAQKAVIKELTETLIMTDETTDKVEHNMDTSRKKHMVRFNTRGTFWKIATAILFGLFAIGAAVNFSWPNLIWKTMQVIIVIAMGYMQMQRAYVFMKTSFADKLNEQSNTMQEFYNIYSTQQEVASIKELTQKIDELRKEFEEATEPETREIDSTTNLNNIVTMANN